jgi:phytoene dehydrogenase-like protein
MGSTRKIVVIGGGIAGLCAAVYARRCGYEAEVLEQHDRAGGLATSWHRGGYTFETCLHWLLGTNPARPTYSQWAEVFDIARLRFVYPQEYVRVQSAGGESLAIYSDINRLESELLARAPQDAVEIGRLVSSVRRLAAMPLPDPSESGPRQWLPLLRAAPNLLLLRKLSQISCGEYGQRFTDPLLRGFFGDGELAQLSALALVFTLAWMSERDAGYPIGGSQAMIRLIVERLAELGGQLRLGARVMSIRVDDDVAVGVRLSDGTEIAGDWVISASDGHATLHDLLGGAYLDEISVNVYRNLQTFPSYLQVSLGVARDLSSQAGFVARSLETPLQVDPQTQVGQLSLRFFNFDPTFAPPGKTAVTCFLPTRNHDYWTRLQTHDPSQYQAEKRRIADSVIAVLEKDLHDIRGDIEVIDVSTPATVIRYTGNWKGSMEGWLMAPGVDFRPLRNTLPGLQRFLMVGQWVMPGGGLPSGLMTARRALRAICRHDGVPFNPLSRPATCA